MDVKKLNHQLTMSEIEQRNIDKRKTLICHRLESIKKLERLYTMDYHHIPKKIKRKTEINNSLFEKIKNSKNIIHQDLLMDKTKLLNQSKKKFESKKSINPIKIDNFKRIINRSKFKPHSVRSDSHNTLTINNIKLLNNNLNLLKKEFNYQRSINPKLNSRNNLNNISKYIKNNKNKKKKNPLEIEDEDKIFNELNNNNENNIIYEKRNKNKNEIIKTPIKNKESRNNFLMNKTRSTFNNHKLCLSDNDKIL